MVKSSKHIDWQKYSERFALSILTDELKIPNESIMESESPDFGRDFFCANGSTPQHHFTIHELNRKKFQKKLK